MVRKRFCLNAVTCLIIFLAVIFKVQAFADPSSPDIQFILKPTYKVGEKVEFKMHNAGKISYSYNEKYPACDLSYFDSAGREFIIPQGTHCDMVVTVEIQPGETKPLFDWDLRECVQDDFGCAKSEPLPEGTYTIKGTFVSESDGGISTEASTTIKIIK